MGSLDLIGKRFGRLLVVERNPKNTNANKTRWKCICDCGNQTIAIGSLLLRGQTRSCGCLKNEMFAQRVTKHGCARWRHKRSKTKEYQAWINMKKRCMNPKSTDYENYGGRGIRICKKWINDFEAFLEDMGIAPGQYTIDRIDNNGNYEPGNCKWSTQTEQAGNRSNNKWIEFKGHKKILTDWAKVIGIDQAGLAWRLKRWPLEKALTQPVRECHAK